MQEIRKNIEIFFNSSIIEKNRTLKLIPGKQFLQTNMKKMRL